MMESARQSLHAKVMGIVNVTPDSFSDGGKYFRPEEAIRRVHNLIEEGADVVDIGAESTRPGAAALSWQQEWERLEPVLRGIVRDELSISVDTYHPETAERALGLGVKFINCVSLASVDDMASLCKAAQVGVVIPANAYNEQLGSDFHGRLYIDPMIGFGTTRDEDLALLRSVPELARKAPVLVGASRKRIVKKLTGEKVTGKNLGGNLAIAVWCALNGASMVRVHDVRETVQALKVMEALGGSFAG